MSDFDEKKGFFENIEKMSKNRQKSSKNTVT
jgi:hypothetical protein